MKKKTETKSAKKTKAQSSGPSAPERRTLASEVREWIAAGMDKEKILEKMVASFIAAGKDEAWAKRRAKNKLAYIVKQGEKNNG